MSNRQICRILKPAVQVRAAVVFLFFFIAAFSQNSFVVSEPGVSGSEKVIDSLETAAGQLTRDNYADSLLAEKEPMAAGVESETSSEPSLQVETYPGEHPADIDTAAVAQAAEPAVAEAPLVSPTSKLAFIRTAVKVRLKAFARGARRYGMHVLVLIAAVAVLAAALGFWFKRRDSERFLTTTRLSVVDKEVQRACNYIEKNHAVQDLNVEILCEALTTGTAFLQALFQRELGMTVESFIDQVRINRARIEIGRQPDMPVDELAVSAGYSDTKTFAQTFLSITGISVEDYRKHV